MDLTQQCPFCNEKSSQCSVIKTELQLEDAEGHGCCDSGGGEQSTMNGHRSINHVYEEKLNAVGLLSLKRRLREIQQSSQVCKWVLQSEKENNLSISALDWTN